MSELFVFKDAKRSKTKFEDRHTIIEKSKKVGWYGLLFSGTAISSMDDPEDKPITTYEAYTGQKRKLFDSTSKKGQCQSNCKSSLFSLMTLLNAILGASLTSVPYAVMQGGLLLGTVLLMVISVIINWSLLLLARSARLASASSYVELMQISFGLKGVLICSVFQVIFALGGMCAYIFVFADNLTAVAQRWLPFSIFVERGFVILTGTILFLLPMSLSNDTELIDSLSLIGIPAVISLLLSMSFTQLNYNDLTKLSLVKWNFIDSIGLITYSLVVHNDYFDLWESRRYATSRQTARMSTLIRLALGISLVASIVLTVPSSISYDGEIDANIYNNLSTASVLTNISRLLTAFSMLFMYAQDCSLARDVILNSFLTTANTRSWYQTRSILTLILISISLAVSLGYSKLELILELTGGLAASGLAFIFPAACYLKLSLGDSYSRSTRRLSKMLIVFGIAVFITSSIAGMYKVFL